MINRPALRAALLAQLQSDLDLQVRAAQLARDEATHEESRPESKYDTHAQEAAYLAEGQARAASELSASLAAYREFVFPPPAPTAAVGHIVTLGTGPRAAHYLLGPRAGGLEVTINGQTILVVTPASPLGRQLAGARVGTNISLPGRPARHLAIAAIT